MHYIRSIITLTAVCLYLLTACNKSQGQPSSPAIPSALALQNEKLMPIRDTILDWIAQHRIPSMAVAVVYQGQLIWLEALGMADLKQQIAATPQTIYPLGSMSKSISATAVMTLVENGQLDLDASVNALIAPGRLQAYQWNADSVKVWHILNSAAGIPHGWTTFRDSSAYPKTDRDKDLLLARYGIITLPPGKYFHYSNYSFGIADLIMERVAMMPLENYLQQALFNPLGMRHSHSTYLPDLQAPYAMTYYRDFSEAGRLNSIPYGGLGYYSSAEDLVHYAMLHLQLYSGKVLSPDNIELMHHFPRTSARRFGLGWHDMGHGLVSNGNVTGANSNLTLIPEEGLAVICLTNITSYESCTDQLADLIINALLPELVKQVTYESYVAEYETPYRPVPELAGKWSGTIKGYGQDLPIRLEFPADGKVYIQVGAAERQALEEVIFNRYGFLNTNFSGSIPLPQYDGTTPNNNELVLYLDDGQLVGHIAAAFSNDQGSFRYGVFTSLQRE